MATDGSALYPSEREKTIARRYGNDFTAVDAAEAVGEHLSSIDTGSVVVWPCSTLPSESPISSTSTPERSSRAAKLAS